MDALTSLVQDVPSWVSRLDDLGSQISPRQQELARIDASHAAPDNPSVVLLGSSQRSLKKSGSTESLRPVNDDSPSPPVAIDNDSDDSGTVTPRPSGAHAYPDGGISRPSPDPTPPDPLPMVWSPSPPASPMIILPASGSAAALMPPPPFQVGKPADTGRSSADRRAHSRAKAADQNRGRSAVQKSQKRRRTDSMLSGNREGHGAPQRRRSMLIIYYDSFVQTFFEDLVRFVATSRNMIHKAKIAAKVTQIKRLAKIAMTGNSDGNNSQVLSSVGPCGEITGLVEATATLKKDVPAPRSSDDSSDDVMPVPDMPALRLTSGARQPSRNGPTPLGCQANPYAPRLSAGAVYSRLSRPRGGLSSLMNPLSTQDLDAYDELDKHLEVVQSSSEKGAHQLLRKGDCNSDIALIRQKLGLAKDIAAKELERIHREEPDVLSAAQADCVSPKSRSFNLMSMRREVGVPASAFSFKDTPALEVDDEGIDDMDDPPQLIFRSTRANRPVTYQRRH